MLVIFKLWRMTLILIKLSLEIIRYNHVVRQNMTNNIILDSKLNDMNVPITIIKNL